MTLNIGIVNDQPAMRAILCQAVRQQAGWQVLWEASGGNEAIALCAGNKPDIILMGLSMPDKNGVAITREIMAASPCAILVVTEGVMENSALVFEALSAGAVDAVDMPQNDLRGLFAKITSVSRLIVQRPSAPQPARPQGLTLVAIGSSTGGPAALRLLLGQLPADFPAAVVIAQHLDEKFTSGMADWLALACKLPVRVIKPGDRPLAGQVLLAGTNDHLVLRIGGALEYRAEPLELPYRPSVDEFFASAALYWPGPIVAVLLTGMGQDGARGLLALRRLGCYTIAQDEKSSVVYGMPGTAVRFGAADMQMNPQQIGEKLARMISSGK